MFLSPVLGNKTNRVKNAHTGIVQAHGIRVCLHAVVGHAIPKMQGLSNKIHRLKNARTRIVQGSWD